MALATAALLPAPALAQLGDIGYGSIGSDFGVDPRVGNLRPQLETYLNRGPALAARPAWLITPALGVDIGATDNVGQVTSPKRADVFTTITPSLSVDGDAARVKVNLAYSPEVTVYATSSSQNRISQFLNGQATGIIVPDAIFLNARASITQQSLSGGGYNQYQTQTYNRQNQVQTTTVSISPSAQHRFSGWGDGVVSYLYSKTLQNTQTNTGSATTNALGTPGYGSPGNLSTSTETASFTSGENLGRIQDQLVVTASQYSGSGSAQGGYRQEIQNNLDYGLTRAITLLSGVGYEQLNYGSSLNTGTFATGLGTGYNYNGPTYSLGVRYAPNPRLSVTVRYGSHDGATNTTFSAQYQITARASFVAGYSSGVTTDLQQAQTQLANTTVGTGGVLTDSTTGAPIRQNNYNATQNGAYRLNRFTASLIFVQERDSYSLSISNDDRTTLTSSPNLLGTSVVAAGTATTTTSAGFSWQHDLAPDTTFNANAQYGISTNTGQFVGTTNRDQRTITLSAILSKRLTETVTANLRYIYTDQSGGTNFNTNANGFSNNGLNGGTFTQNTILLGLRKSF